MIYDNGLDLVGMEKSDKSNKMAIFIDWKIQK